MTVTSGNYSRQGAWLGEPNGDGVRSCGYLMHERYTVFFVNVVALDCAQAAATIDAYLDHEMRPPAGWTASFRRFRLGAGGAPGSSAVRGAATIKRQPQRQALSFWLSVGRKTAPPIAVPVRGVGAVRFGCHTRSSICS